ncbi:hypothetical protein BDBG_00923 [Blastomyces gilchristii SLH14081]|uniref:Uncharacterized protein n=1 Tax=Blastomyces gilchristii (strain SLH14081) TaxID=559298 RepID=A0A179U8N5_BLAGS|nr:uncharacterized protein BDBG_00923 [Blastomyces gilchristii SLH14081]OAT04355.1 hypothetical protein BDBG_00923 [Blastomyces gilchristii SLH14081]
MGPRTSSSHSRKRRAGSPPSSTSRDTKTISKTSSTSAYSRNFQQNLIDHVIPILDGDISDPKCVGGDYSFRNLTSLTDGTLAAAKPDHFYGACPEQLNHQIRVDLSHHIVPDDLPMAPNFVFEAKGPDGSLAVATRQACYDGALGARGMHALQSYQQGEPTYDNNAYTLTSTYHGGQLKLYTTHVSKSDNPDRASAYRNGRDWAKETRDELTRVVNTRFSEARSPHSSIFQHRTTSDLTPILDDSDGSTERDEYQNAQWTFAAPVEEEEVPRGNPKTPKIRASESLGTAGHAAS